MPIADLERIEYALKKRGFRRDDVLYHECPTCKVKAVATYKITGRVGGRDISLCLDCGEARSWRSSGGFGDRSEDPDFDLHEFLK